MTPKVKRYAPSFCVQSEDLSMDETEDGGHVKHEDYERLENAFNELVSFIEREQFHHRCIGGEPIGGGHLIDHVLDKACQIKSDLTKNEQDKN